MSVRVANEFPSRSSATRIAFIGEAPGSDETRLGRPFIGSAGKLLDAHLSAAGISRAECFVGNLCQHQPPGNQLAAWAWEDSRIQDGIAQLLVDLRAFQPYLIVTLGNWPLHLFKCGNTAPQRTKSGNVTFESKVGVWRGSLFWSHETLWAEANTSVLSNGKQRPDLREARSREVPSSQEGVVGDAPLDELVGGSVQGPLEGVGRSMDRACIPPPLPPTSLWPGNAAPALAPTHGPVPPCGPDGTGGELALTTPSTHYPQLPSSQGVRACAADTVQARLEEAHTSRPANAGPDCPGERCPSLCASGGGVVLGGRAPVGLTCETGMGPVLKVGESHSFLPAAPLRFKCLSTLHPAFVLRAWANGFDLRQDLLRTREEGRSPALELPVVETVYGPSL